MKIDPCSDESGYIRAAILLGLGAVIAWIFVGTNILFLLN
jgi:hypothetical protein